MLLACTDVRHKGASVQIFGARVSIDAIQLAITISNSHEVFALGEAVLLGKCCSPRPRTRAASAGPATRLFLAPAPDFRALGKSHPLKLQCGRKQIESRSHNFDRPESLAL
jgi:hypothetical protein